MAAALYHAGAELVAAGTALSLSLGRPYPYAVVRVATRHNQGNRLYPVVFLMQSVAFAENVAMLLLAMEVMELWMVIAVALVAQGVAGVKLAFRLGLAPSPYRHWKYTRSLSFLLVIVLWATLHSHPLILRTVKTWHL